jgi:hypothetical protein
MHSGDVYHAGNHIFRTKDGGQNWEQVSPDLSRNDKQKQQWSGGPITGDNTGAETYCTVFALAESVKEPGVFWAGTDDGKVHLSKDNCATWVDLTANIPDLPDWGTVECIEPSAHDAGTVYLAVDNHRMDDYRPHLWKTTDYGTTWTKIGGGLPQVANCNVIREDSTVKGLLYVGTERGIHMSRDGGETWSSLKLNLPTVPVTDLQVKDASLVVGTQGRSLWILDDLTVLRHLKSVAPADVAHFYPVQDAIKWNIGGSVIAMDRTLYRPNPVEGASLWFHLSEKPSQEITIEITNAAGVKVAVAKSKPKDDKGDAEDADGQSKVKRSFEAKQGLNFIAWDMTHDGADTIPGAKVDAGNPGRTIPVLPGRYKATLTIGEKVLAQEFAVLPDPRLKSEQISPAQEELALKLRGHIQQLTETVIQLKAVQQQIKLRADLFKDQDSLKALAEQEQTYAEKLFELEGKLHNPKAKVVYDVFAARGGAMLYSQLTWLLNNVVDGDGPPTTPQLELEAELAKVLADLKAEFGTLTTTDLNAINAEAQKLSVPGLYLPPVPKR